MEKYNEILTQLERLERIIKKNLADSPTGALIVDMHMGKYPQYYLREDLGDGEL